MDLFRMTIDAIARKSQIGKRVERRDRSAFIPWKRLFDNYCLHASIYEVNFPCRGLCRLSAVTVAGAV